MMLLVWSVHLDAQAQKSELVLPMGHASWVLDAEYSPDGKYIVTGSMDHTSVLIEVESGLEIRRFKGHTNWVLAVEFNYDGTQVLTTCVDGYMRIFNVETGILLHRFGSGKFGTRMHFSQFTPNGQIVCSVGEKGALLIYDLKRKDTLFNIKAHERWIYRCGISPDGKYVSTACSDSTSKIFEIATGKLVHTISHNEPVQCVKWSSDSKLQLSTSVDVKVFSLDQEKVAQTLTGHRDFVVIANFSPDDKHIVTASYDSTSRIYNINTGELEVELMGHNDEVRMARFSPDGNYILTSCYDNYSRIFNASTGKLVHKLEGHTNGVRYAKYNHDGSQVVSVARDNMMHVYNAADGTLNFRFERRIGHAHPIERSNYGIFLKVLNQKPANIIVRYNASTSLPIDTIAGHNNYIKATTIDPTEKWIGSVSYNKKKGESKLLVHNIHLSSPPIKIIDTLGRVQDIEINSSFQILSRINNNGIGVYDLKTQLRVDHITMSDGISKAIWAAEKNDLIIGTRLGELILYDQVNNQIKKSVHLFDDEINCIRASSDGKYIIAGGNFGSVFVVKCQDFSIRELPGHSRDVRRAIFSDDNQSAATVSWDETINIYDVATGKVIQQIKGLDRFISNIWFTPNGKQLIVSELGRIISYWSIETGAKLYTQLHFENGDWLVFDPDYRYDGSPRVRDQLYFTCGLERIGLTQIKDALYVPGLLERIQNEQTINYPKLSDLPICNALPIIEKGNSIYTYRITPRSMGLKSVEVYINQKRIKTVLPKSLGNKENVYTLVLDSQLVKSHFLPNVQNEIEVVGVVSSGLLELRSRGAKVKRLHESSEKTIPKLFAVMIGISDYKGADLDLQFPVRDAESLSMLVETSAKKFLGSENVEMYNIFPDEAHLNQTPEKLSIKNALAEIGGKAKSNDIILIFFAGHGVMVGQEEKHFTLLTAEASSSNQIGITTDELMDWLSADGPHKVLANKTILIMDACNSGGFTNELLAMGRSNGESQRLRQVEDLKDKSGLFILAASAQGQSAYELTSYGHGLLTYAMLKTVKQNPSILDNGEYLNVQKWFLSSEEELQELVERNGLRQDASPFGTANIRIGRIDSNLIDRIEILEEKTYVSCNNALNSSLLIDNLDIKQRLNSAIDSLKTQISQLALSTNNATGYTQINLIYTVDNDNLNIELILIKNHTPYFRKKLIFEDYQIDEVVKDLITLLELEVVK